MGYPREGGATEQQKKKRNRHGQDLSGEEKREKRTDENA